jgi:hypothetical protein
MMTFTRASWAKIAWAASAAISLATPLAVQAGPATINATQLSIQVAPITISGTKLGAEVTASGSGLTASNLPTISATGATGAVDMTAAADSSFSYAVTARSADAAATQNTLDNASTFIPTTAFGNQSGTFSSPSANAGSISLVGNGVPTITTTANGQGVTATAIYSSTFTSDVSETQVRRIATTATDQSGFTADRQGSSFTLTGSGLTAVTAGGLTAGAVNTAPTITARAGGDTQANVTFTASQSQLLGQDSVAPGATNTSVTQPGYGKATNNLGGAQAGGITAATGINSLGVTAGGQGSSTTLSVVQSLTAF